MCNTVVVKESHRNREEENSRVCLERHHWAELKSAKQKELSNVNRRTVVNYQQSYDRVHAVYLLTNCA